MNRPGNIYIDTVEVRIAVSVDADGHWVAYGCSEDSDREAQKFTVETMSPGQATHFVTATLPKPQFVEIATERVDQLISDGTDQVSSTEQRLSDDS